MDNYLSVFRGILSTDGPFLDIYLDCLDEHKVFAVQNNDEADLMQHITSLLTTSTTRFLGLRLLDKFIDSCSVDVLERKGDLWTTLVLKACNNQELQYDASLIFHVLNKLIKSSQQTPDLAKSFASAHIPKAYDSLTKVPLSKSKYALSCIETCLRVYPGSSGPSRGIIERFLWKNIDHMDYEVVQNCGKCLHLLQQVKGAQGVNHKTQWKNYQLQLMGGIHSVYNKMFANCTEMYEDKIEEEKLPWETEQIGFDTEPVKKAAQMYTRCRNLVTYLIIALREQFPVEKPILIRKILNVITRGLNVNCLMLERNPIADNIALSILLPRLHIDLLNLLNVTVTILRGHLRPYSELVLDLMVDELKWISTKSLRGQQKTLLFLRKRVYDSISLWCKIFCSGNRCETISEHLFQEILSDITPTQSELTLKVLSCTRKHMSKKARRQLHNGQNEKSNMAKTHSGDRQLKETFFEKREQELCISALRCLQEVIFSVANFMKPTILKMMLMRITQISAIFYEIARKPTLLYSNKSCRMEIYNALYAILTTTHHLCPPPTEFVLSTIQTACVRDDSLKVRIRCGFILRNLEKIIHPQKESLLFPIEARDIRNAFIKMGQENLLRECELNFTNNNVIEDVPHESVNSQFLNTPLTSHGMESEQDNNNMQALSTSISENNEEIQNEEIDSADIGVMEEEEEPYRTIEEPYTTNKNIDNLSKLPKCVLLVDNGIDITAANKGKEDALNDPDTDEPSIKKQKLDDKHNETDGTKYANIIKNMDRDDDDVLAEIASEFIDELE